MLLALFGRAIEFPYVFVVAAADAWLACSMLLTFSGILTYSSLVVESVTSNLAGLDIVEESFESVLHGD